jgi:antitoxin VapB
MDLYRTLGKDCGKIIGEVAIAIRPSMSEWEIAGSLTGKCYECGIIPVVVLIAADERIDTNRHPLPTNKRVKNKAMVVLCGRRAGLIVSLTRVVYITTKTQAQIPEDLLNRHHAATFVDAVALVHTKPGAQASTIFKAIQDAYATKGFEGEWRLHHQGGCTAYKSREWVASSSSTVSVLLFCDYINWTNYQSVI